MNYILFFVTQNKDGAVFELLDENANLFYKHLKTRIEIETLNGIRGFVDHDYERACVEMMAKGIVGVRI